MNSVSETTLRLHGDALHIYADTWGALGMTVTVADDVGNALLRLSAADAADLHNLLMRCLTAVASTAARERPDEPEPAEDRTLPPCGTCGEEPVCVIDGPVRQCSGCYLAAQEVGV